LTLEKGAYGGAYPLRVIPNIHNNWDVAGILKRALHAMNCWHKDRVHHICNKQADGPRLLAFKATG
jgi:hypothetical protein